MLRHAQRRLHWPVVMMYNHMPVYVLLLMGVGRFCTGCCVMLLRCAAHAACCCAVCSAAGPVALLQGGFCGRGVGVHVADDHDMLCCATQHIPLLLLLLLR